MYAIARYYITDFAIYQTVTEEYFCLRMEWDMFTPGIAEKTEFLKPLSDFQKKEVRNLRALEKQLISRFPDCGVQIVSIAQSDVFLSSKTPGSNIVKLSKAELLQLSEQQLKELAQMNTGSPVLRSGSLDHIDYLDFLRFMVRFQRFSLENIIRLYRYHPRATLLHSFAEWNRMNFVISQDAKKYSAILPIRIQCSLFERDGAAVPLEHAVESERAAIAEQKLPVFKKEYDALLEVWDEFDVCRVRSPFVRTCNPQLFFETISKLAKVQGFEVVKNPDICESYYQQRTKTIHLPQGGNVLMYAKWICREYAAALVEETAAFSGKKLNDLAAESLAWMLCYRYGFDTSAEYLVHYYRYVIGEKFLEELTVYLYNAFRYIQENIEETLLSDIEVEQTIRKNLLSNVEKFKNRRAE